MQFYNQYFKTTLLCLIIDMSSGPISRISSGVVELDSLLQGGLVANRLYLVTGRPGTGKTLTGVHFLNAGLAADEDVLFIHGEESQQELIVNAAELGIDLAAADFLDIGPESEFFAESRSYDVVNPQDVEGEQLIGDIRQAIERRDPDRVLIDPITQLQYIEPTEYQFRKRIISLTRFLKDSETTVLATKTPATQMSEPLQSLSDGVIQLTHEGENRRISVTKHRGVGQRSGSHGFEIKPDGVQVYPAIRPEQHERTFDPVALPSGVDGLDDILNGGLEQGTVTIISGPSGVGKSTTAAEFLEAAATRSGGLAYLFEESIETFTHRAETFDIPITQLRNGGSLTVEEVLPQTMSPEEFAATVKSQVESSDVRLVVIDGIEGYKTALKSGGENVNLQARLHALTRYLMNMNVTVVLISERHEITGLSQPTGSNISHLADNLIFQQYVELDGKLQRVVGVLKKRVSGFESKPRKYRITTDGIAVGEPLTDIKGIGDGISERTDNGAEPGAQ